MARFPHQHYFSPIINGLQIVDISVLTIRVEKKSEGSSMVHKRGLQWELGWGRGHIALFANNIIDPAWDLSQFAFCQESVKLRLSYWMTEVTTRNFLSQWKVFCVWRPIIAQRKPSFSRFLSGKMESAQRCCFITQPCLGVLQNFISELSHKHN